MHKELLQIWSHASLHCVYFTVREGTFGSFVTLTFWWSKDNIKAQISFVVADCNQLDTPLLTLPHYCRNLADFLEENPLPQRAHSKVAKNKTILGFRYEYYIPFRSLNATHWTLKYTSLRYSRLRMFLCSSSSAVGLWLNRLVRNKHPWSAHNH